MRLGLILIVIVLVGCTQPTSTPSTPEAPAQVQTAAAEHAAISFPAIVQVATPAESTTITLLFTGRNQTDQSLAITKMSSGCSCATVTASSETVAPGSEVTLTLVTTTPPAKVNAARQRFPRELAVWYDGQAKPQIMQYAFGLPAGATQPALTTDPAGARHPLTGSSAVSSTADTAVSLEDINTDMLLPQRTCPFKDERIKPTHWLEFDGGRIYTCCDPCIQALVHNPRLALRYLADNYGERPMTEREWQAWERRY